VGNDALYWRRRGFGYPSQPREALGDQIRQMMTISGWHSSVVAAKTAASHSFGGMGDPYGKEDAV
jgi:hypothetical protein